jgi:chromosome segregation ATPase
MFSISREGKMDDKKELEMEYDIYPHPKMDEKVKEIVAEIKEKVILASEYLRDDEIYLSLGYTKILLSLLSEKDTRISEWQGKYTDLGEIVQGLRNENFELSQRVKELENKIEVSKIIREMEEKVRKDAIFEIGRLGMEIEHAEANIKELEAERHRLSQLLIEARTEICNLKDGIKEVLSYNLRLLAEKMLRKLVE